MQRPTKFISDSSSRYPVSNSIDLDDSPIESVLRNTHSSSKHSNVVIANSRSSDSGQRNVVDKIDLIVFLPDHTGLKFPSVGGTHINAADILLAIAHHLKIDAPLLMECCALWLISPLLEVQLKPHHIPYAICTGWSSLLIRFSDCEEKERSREKPCLYLRRNIHLSIPREELIEDESEELTKILYMNAKQEVMNGRYPCDIGTSVKLAALQMSIEYGRYDKTKHNVLAISEIIDKLVPAHHLHNMKSIFLFGHQLLACKGVENEILEEYKTNSKYDNNHSKHKAYLILARQLPPYGSAFFHGELERSTAKSYKYLKRMLLAVTSPEIEVYIAINHVFITIIDSYNHDVLFVQPIPDSKWLSINRVHDNTNRAEDDDRLSSFLLYFSDDTYGSECLSEPLKTESIPIKRYKLLQIFSQQAVMMQALLNVVQSIYSSKGEDIRYMDDYNSVSRYGEDIVQMKFPDDLRFNSGEKHLVFHGLSTMEDQSTVVLKGNHSPYASSPSPSSGNPSTPFECNSPSQSPLEAHYNSMKCKSYLQQVSQNSSTNSGYSDKVCLATFDETERCIEAQGSLRSILQEVK